MLTLGSLQCCNVPGCEAVLLLPTPGIRGYSYRYKLCEDHLRGAFRGLALGLVRMCLQGPP